LDFALRSSSKGQKRLHRNEKVVDKRCFAYQRRREATQKATAHLADMVRRILATGIKAQYVLMDSWFTPLGHRDKASQAVAGQRHG